MIKIKTRRFIFIFVFVSCFTKIKDTPPPPPPPFYLLVDCNGLENAVELVYEIMHCWNCAPNFIHYPSGGPKWIIDVKEGRGGGEFGWEKLTKKEIEKCFKTKDCLCFQYIEFSSEVDNFGFFNQIWIWTKFLISQVTMTGRPKFWNARARIA